MTDSRTRRGATILVRTAWLAALLAGLCAATAGPLYAYEVVPGSKGNTLHLAIDDRADWTKGLRVEAVVLESPSWLTLQETRVESGRGTEVFVSFDIAEIAPGASGSLALRISGSDRSGNQVFERTRRINLIARKSAEPVQRTFDIQECCLPATDVQGPTAIPSGIVLVGNRPNPFGPLTSVIFGLPASGGSVQMSIFDVQGRMVRGFATPSLQGGYHQITWDGRSDAGRDLSPGIYLYRLTSGDWSATGKMQLLR